MKYGLKYESGSEVNTLHLHDLSVRSRAGDQGQEKLPVHCGHVVAVYSLTCGLADGGAVHDGTPHWVLVTLALRNMLKKKKKL